MKMINLIATALILSGSVFSAANAAAQSDVPTTLVKFGDLDMTQTAGKDALYRRLALAGRTVCRSFDPGMSSVRLTALYNACIDKAVLGAVAKINSQDFTDYVASLTPKARNANIQLAAR